MFFKCRRTFLQSQGRKGSLQQDAKHKIKEIKEKMDMFEIIVKKIIH